MERRKIDISTWTIIKIILILLLLWIFWVVKDVVFLVILILIVVSALVPVVDTMERIKMPRILGVLIVYLTGILILVVIGLAIIPVFIDQIRQIAENLPNIIEKLTPTYYIVKDYYTTHSTAVSISQSALDTLSKQLSNISTNIFSATIGVVNGVVIVITFIILTFYLLLDKGNLKEFFETIVPLKNKDEIFEVMNKIGQKWGRWLRGQLLLSLIIGVTVWIVLLIIGVPYALTLAVVAALAEFIPLIGATLGAIPAILIAFVVSPLKALFVLIAFLVIQQVENHILVPKIMGRMVGLSPVIIIIAILVGAKLFGAIGVILAVPLATGLVVVLQEWKIYHTSRKKTIAVNEK